MMARSPTHPWFLAIVIILMMLAVIFLLAGLDVPGGAILGSAVISFLLVRPYVIQKR
jgi:hypothetical protein